jgi:hypothetical protein
LGDCESHRGVVEETGEIVVHVRRDHIHDGFLSLVDCSAG